MASKNLIDIALQLGSKLGANTSKFLGTRSNVNFLGTGPKDGMLFQKDINPESFVAIGIEKVLPDIESSLAYAASNKLNDFQLNQLIKNLKTMDETANPTNILSMGGLDSLRAKSGIGERQVTEAVQDAKDAEGLAALRDPRGLRFDEDSGVLKSMVGKENASGLRIDDLPPPGSRGGADDIAAPAIMETVPKVDLPGKTASAREFLVNALKKENPNQTTFADIVDPADIKFITEGGGGVDGDPIVLVQKYFGPRIAEMLPVNASSEEIAIFTNRVVNNMVDAKGLKPSDPNFDNLTARFIDELANGGRAGYAKGGLAKILEL